MILTFKKFGLDLPYPISLTLRLPSDPTEETTETLLSDLLDAVTQDEEIEGVAARLPSQPIPMPYYPLFSTSYTSQQDTSTFNSIVS